MFVKNKDGKGFSIGQGIDSKILAHGDSMMAVENLFDEGTLAAKHSHEHEQIAYLVKGLFEFYVEDEKHVLKPGDSVYIPSNAVHGGFAIEESIILDIFTPQRADFLKKVK